jgi:hypothetical protein
VEQKRKELKPSERQPARTRKKPYTTPVVTEYGNVAKLTQGGNGSISDGLPGGSQRKSCL